MPAPMVINGWELEACTPGDERPNLRHIVAPSPDRRHAAVIYGVGEASFGVETGRLMILAAPSDTPSLLLSSNVVCVDAAPQWLDSRIVVAVACRYVCTHVFVDVEQHAFARRPAALDMIGRPIVVDGSEWLLPGSDDRPDEHPPTRVRAVDLSWRLWSEIQ